MKGTVGGPLATSELMTQLGPKVHTTPRPRVYIDWGLIRTGGDFNAITEALATTRGREMVALLPSPNYGYVVGRGLTTVEDPTVEDPTGEHQENSWGRRIGPALAGMVGP